MALDDPALVAGFHEIEASAAGRWRWTSGDAHVSRDLWAGATGAAVALRFTGCFEGLGETVGDQTKRADEAA